MAGSGATPEATPAVTIVPANEAAWDDLQAVFGTRGDASRCQCQWFEMPKAEMRVTPVEVLSARLREQARCGEPEAESTTGLVAYVDGEPAGWCAVEPRTAYPNLQRARVPWSGRQQDKADDGVWAVTCFVTRSGFRRRGVSKALARAAAAFARARGARAVEGYALVTHPGMDTPNTSLSRMNSWRVASHVCPTLVRNSTPANHSSLVRFTSSTNAWRCLPASASGRSRRRDRGRAADPGGGGRGPPRRVRGGGAHRALPRVPGAAGGRAGHLLHDALRRARERGEDLSRAEVTARIEALRRLITEQVRARLVAEGEAAAVAPPTSPFDVELARATAVELAEARAAVRPLARRLAARLRRRRQSILSGAVDMKRTARRSVGTGGVPIDVANRRPHAHKPEVFTLCDLSGSVADAAGFTLTLMAALAGELASTRSFAFVDAVDEITDVVAACEGVVEPWQILQRGRVIGADGHSDYGAVLGDFRDRCGRALGPRSTVIITGDAATTTGPPKPRSSPRSPAAPGPSTG